MKTKKSSWVLVTVFCLGLFGASVAQAASSVLELIPENAMGFGLINRIGEIDAKTEKLVKQLQLSIPGTPLQTVKQMTKTEKGLDEKGTVVVIAMPADDPDGRPDPIVIVPVTDYQEFIGQFDPEKVTETISRVLVIHGRSLVAHKDGYAIFAELDKQELLESILANKTSLAGQLKPWEAWIGQSDAVVAITGKTLKMLTGKGDEEIEKLKPMMEAMGQQSQQAIASLEMYQKLLNLAGQEVTMAGVGVLIEKDGSLRLSGMGQFAPDGQLADSFKNLPPLPSNPWTGIPKEPFVVAGTGVISEPLMDNLMVFSFDMLKKMPDLYGLNEEQMEQVKQMSVKTMKQVHGMSMAMGVVKKDQPVYQGFTGAVWVDDSETFLDQYTEMVKTMAKLTDGNKPSLLKDMKATPIEIAGHKGIEVSVNLSAMFGQPGMPQVAQHMLKVMYGSDDTMKVYLAAADKNTVVFAYISKDGAVRAVEAIVKSGGNFGSDPLVAATAKQLTPDAQWVGFWSPSGTVGMLQQVFKAFGPEDADSKITLPEFPKTPPIGFSVKASSTQVYKELFIPVEVLKEVHDYLMKLHTAGRAQPVDIEIDEVDEVEVD